MYITYEDINYRLSLKIKELVDLQNELLLDKIGKLNKKATEEDKEKYLYNNNL